MNAIRKLYLKACDKFLYTKPPKRMENGLKVMDVHFEYEDDKEILRFTVDRLCRLIVTNVSKKTFDDFIEFQFKQVNWLDYRRSVALCLWFETRGCKVKIGHVQKPATWFECYVSDVYVTGFKQEALRQYLERESQKAS